MFSLSEYIHFIFILLYTRRAISTQTNPKSVLVEKKGLVVSAQLYIGLSHITITKIRI
jgi:hypothetical protein